MTAYVKFSVNPETNKLKIEAVTNEASTLETIFAKKTLSIATRLAFVELQQLGVYDVGAQIVINSYGDSEEKMEEMVSTFDGLLNKSPVRTGTFKISPDGKKAIPVQKESSVQEEELSETGWKVGEEEVSLSLDLDDANEVIGGLASVSATSAMTVFVLLKQTVHAVEDHYGLEHKTYPTSEGDEDYDEDYEEHYENEEDEFSYND
jgi:hypothetical protein